ncbi:MAG: Translation initiation factor IF-2 [Alphaproteobacteria bacterium MarineAlpha6_Bin5]|nr:MAG: Translation initiation factor IF-2 [Alphaproteobacteria bacterium MarineAlpha6_Bin5]|tara:strand:- start:4137 stop:6167 length:2031 start_codon:yes stop_codon:yes gene_type:complete
MNDKNRKTTTIKQTFSYGKSKTVTVEVVQKKKKINKDIPLNKTEEKKVLSDKPRKKLTINKRFFSTIKKNINQRNENKSQSVNDEKKKIVKEVKIPEIISVQELAKRMAEKSSEVIKALMKNGVMVTINQNIDADTAEIIAQEFGHNVVRVDDSELELNLKKKEEDKEEDLVERAPIVTIMGHVDHGKTTLLDAFRSSSIVSKEHGGITQHIGAYRIFTKKKKYITFFDTPGHEAFTAMRSRGAKVTDIVVLVVAADDGVKETTIEAINHAKAADVPIIVCINKIDLSEANSQNVKNQLMEHEILSEDMGGKNLFVEVSAKSKTNLDKLEEAILLQSEILSLKANPSKKANGVVVESKVQQGKGSTATVLIQEGSLKVGDLFVAGPAYGKVRAMTDDLGKKITIAKPSVPVEIIGITGVPIAGDEFRVVENEAKAKEIATYKLNKSKINITEPLTKESLEKQLSEKSNEKIKELGLILKSDVQGSLEAIVNGLEKFKNDEIKIKIVHKGVGEINQSDVALAVASESEVITVGFNVKPNNLARDLAKRDKIDIKFFTVIYELLDYIKDSMSGLLVPDKKEVLNGKAKIKEIFKMSKIGKIAGCEVIEGKIDRSSNIRLFRDNKLIYDGKLNSLKKFKEEASEVKEGSECGMVLDNFQDIKQNDILESYIVEEQKRSL